MSLFGPPSESDQPALASKSQTVHTGAKRARVLSSASGGLIFVIGLALAALLLPARAPANLYYATSYANGVGNNQEFIGCAITNGTRVNNQLLKVPDVDHVNTQLYALAASNTHIYWSNGEHIARANLDGTGVKLDFISVPDVLDLAVDDEHIYWREYRHDSSGRSTGLYIGRANLDGSAVNRDLVAAFGTFPYENLFIYGRGRTVAVGAGHVYFSQSGGIGRANLDGSNVQIGSSTDPFGFDNPFIDSLERGELGSYLGPEDVVVASTGLVWNNSEVEGFLGRAGLDGNDINERFASLSSSNLQGSDYAFLRLAAEAGKIYWAANPPFDPHTSTRATVIRAMNEDGSNDHAVVDIAKGDSSKPSVGIYLLAANGAPASACPAPAPPPPPDTSVDAEVTANRLQKQRGKRIAVKVKVSAGEDLTAMATGTVKMSKKTSPLAPSGAVIAAEMSKKLKLTMSGRRAMQVRKALKHGKRVRAKLTVELKDSAENVFIRHPPVLLTR